MSKIIDFDKARPKQQEHPLEPNTDMLPTTYYLCRNDERGREVSRVPLDGDEHVKTSCPGCGKEFWIDLYEFFDIVSNGFCFYSSIIYCNDCSAKRAMQ